MIFTKFFQLALLGATAHAVAMPARKHHKHTTVSAAQASTTAAPPSSTGNPSTAQPPTAKLSPGIPTNCNNFWHVQPGDWCINIVSQVPGLALQDLYLLNPAIDANCYNLQIDTYLCVGTNGPANPSQAQIQPGSTPKCTKWQYVTAGQTCDGVVAMNPGITLKEFIKWNPTVGEGCPTMWAGYYVCVAV